MSAFYEVEPDVNQILLDPVNPRHDVLQAQIDLIKAMIDDQKEKLVRLAEDIVDSGLNPSDRVTVIPHAEEKNKYVVVEGNRRIAALKLLASPSLCHDIHLRRRFEALHVQYMKQPITKVQCVAYADRKVAEHWIRLKHTGQNAGVGTVEWDTVSIKRFQAQDGNNKESLGLQLLNFLLKNLSVDEETEKAIRSMPITTIERLIGDPDVRKHLGLTVEHGVLRSKLKPDIAARAIFSFLAPVISGEKKVTHVYYKEDRARYTSDAGPAPVDDSSNLSNGTWDLNSPPKPVRTAPPARQSSPIKRSKPLSTARKFLIPSQCVIKISISRINAIYLELKNQLVVNDMPNACAVLLRVFLEVSIDSYITKQKMNAYPDELLHKKLTRVADHLENVKILTKSELKPVRLAVSKPNGLFSTNTLNAYVHNPNIHPRPDDLKLTWDEMEIFVKKLWE